ncbi:MAG: IS5/IS1182 family transposase, partial [Thermoplasmata archaeon]
MSARRGKPYRDHRDWPTCNGSLVVRGEFYLDLGSFRTWDQELATMNRGKRGGQFRIPESFVRWLVIWKQLVDYRG